MMSHNVIGVGACRPPSYPVVQRRDPALLARSRASVRSFLVLRHLIVALRAVVQEDDVLTLHRSSRCRANLARGLRIHFRTARLADGRAARLPVSGFDPQA